MNNSPRDPKAFIITKAMQTEILGIVGITAIVPAVRELFYWIKKLFKV